eukprot:54705-Eustigmatos_ZCMA.PRE.1
MAVVPGCSSSIFSRSRQGCDELRKLLQNVIPYRFARQLDPLTVLPQSTCSVDTARPVGLS